MKRLEAFLAKKINSAIDREEYSWPPVCLGIFHQPERPTKTVYVETIDTPNA